MKSKNKYKESLQTAKKNDAKEKPVMDEDLKETGKGITSSKGSFKSADDIKGKRKK